MVNHMRHTRAHTGNRRAHHAIAGTRLVACPKCKVKKLSRAVCMNCGTYRGREVINVMAKATKLEKKAKRQEQSKGPRA